MALNKVGARTAGDVYQGLFFWQQAADLLRPSSLVSRVVLEHDEADGVDDVAVFYRDPGVNAGRCIVTADYFQLKYHVDNSDCYSSAAIMDASFIHAKSSLLQRFYKAYLNLSKDHSQFRLYLASNWRWREDDRLAALIREDDGELPRRFFEDGPQGDLGKIREQWRTHLGLDIEKFTNFADTLRFDLNHFGRRNFRASVYATLEAAGLNIPSAERVASPYESLIQQFLMNGTNSFDEKTFRDLCKREGLLIETKQNRPRPPSIGVRSFIRFAERLESEVDELVCVTKYFENRHPSSVTSWAASVSQILSFLGDIDRRARLRTCAFAVALECHGSLALLTGWELSRNSGVQAAPIQKPNFEVWQPTDDSTASVMWDVKTIQKSAGIDDVAICLSVTHDIYKDVEEFLSSTNAPTVSRIALLTPEGGPSPQSIHGPNHAYQLAVQLPSVLANIRPNRRARAHIFFSCPNSLMFFIGQQREALGRLVLYEFDFGLERDGSYQHSFSLPITESSIYRAQEVHDDSSH